MLQRLRDHAFRAPLKAIVHLDVYVNLQADVSGWGKERKERKVPLATLGSYDYSALQLLNSQNTLTVYRVILVV